MVTPTLPIEPFATGVKMLVKRSGRFLALVKQSRRLLGAGRRSRRIIRLTVKAAIIKCKRADPPMPPYIIIQTMPVIAGGAYVCVCSIALLPMCLVVVGGVLLYKLLHGAIYTRVY